MAQSVPPDIRSEGWTARLTIRCISTATRCAGWATRSSTCWSSGSPRSPTDPCSGPRPRRDGGPDRRAAAGRGPPVRGAAGAARPRRAAVRRPLRPSPVLRLHPGRRDVAGGARRPDRGGDEHRRRCLARGGRTQSARADGPRLVPRVDGLPDRCRGRPRVRRLRGQPHRDRLCPRSDRRADVAADRGVHERPDPFVAGPGGPPSRLPAGPDPGPRDRRAVPAAGRRPRRRDRRRPGRGPAAVPRQRERRHDEHRRRRRPGGDLGDLPRARDLDARRRRIRRLRGPDRAWPRCAARSRTGGLGDARPAQVAGDAVRGRLPDGPRGRRARGGLRAPPGVPPGAIRRHPPRRSTSPIAASSSPGRAGRSRSGWRSRRSASTRSGPSSTGRST